MALTMHWREEIAAPPERVFAAMADLESFGTWMPGFVRIERLTPPPTGVGTRFRETRKMMGHEATEEFEVTAFEPPLVFGLFCDGKKGSSKSGEFRFRYTLAPGGPGTILTVDGEVGGLTGCMRRRRVSVRPRPTPSPPRPRSSARSSRWIAISTREPAGRATARAPSAASGWASPPGSSRTRASCTSSSRTCTHTPTACPSPRSPRSAAA